MRGRAGPRPDGGTVTAEFALALPAVMIVLALILGTGQALVAQLRCVDAARAAARLAARGESAERSVAEAQRLAPSASRINVAAVGDAALGGGAVGDGVTVRVTARLRLPLGIDVPLEAVAVADREQP